MNTSKTVLFLLALAGVLTLSGEILKNRKGIPVPYAGIYSNTPVNLPQLHFRRVQMRAVWCAVVNNLDFPRCTNEKQFKRNFAAVIAQLRRHNCNVLFFQVRANGDAVYLSRYNPFSAWISGRAGTPLGNFDPLPYMVRECRRNGIEFHAWLNPYRITGSTSLSKQKYLNTLPARHLARLRPDLVLASRNRNGTWALQYDPGRPEVINHILNTVNEIISRAPVSAICFDDYFYPYTPLQPGTDRRSFLHYNPKGLSLADWRRENVNSLIAAVSRLCRSRRVRFGVSPFGIWANAKNIKGGSLTGGMQAREDIFADTLLWVRRGYLDYIIPQIYWNFAHPKAAYAALTDWWVRVARRYPGTELYIGHGLYNISSTELYNQLRYNSVHPEIRGEALYSLRHLRNGKLSTTIRHCWPAAVPSRQFRTAEEN
ncbi:MAG: hypothetical protein E7048_04665 [Lentisphaerae bacterium]|nr:hypothetical protein [Lentisphaerota bacterium]